MRRWSLSACRDPSGITLVEMLIVILLLVTIITGVATLMATTVKADVDLSKRVRAQQQARLAIDRIRQDVHCSIPPAISLGAASSVTITLPAGCPSGHPSAEQAVTWCTRATGARWTLYRLVGTDCPDPLVDPDAALGTPVAEHLIRSDVFFYEPESTTRAILKVTFPIQLEHSHAQRPYQLEDDLVFRNGA